MFSNESCLCVEYAAEQSFENAAGLGRLKQEVIIENLESKIKEQSAVIEKKDFELQTPKAYWRRLKLK